MCSQRSSLRSLSRAWSIRATESTCWSCDLGWTARLVELERAQLRHSYVVMTVCRGLADRTGRNVMEVAPGVFVTAASTREWQSHPHPAGEIHVLCRGVGLHAGLWRCVPGTTPQQLEWTASGREAKIVLAGTSSVGIKDGPTLE